MAQTNQTTAQVGAQIWQGWRRGAGTRVHVPGCCPRPGRAAACNAPPPATRRRPRPSCPLPTDVIAEEAEKFILQAADDSRPFFAYIAPYAPHPPYLPAVRHRGAFAGTFAPVRYAALRIQCCRAHPVAACERRQLALLPDFPPARPPSPACAQASKCRGARPLTSLRRRFVKRCAM